MEFELVDHLRRVAAQQEKLGDGQLEGEIARILRTETAIPLQPTGVEGHVIPEHGETLGHRIVARTAGSERQARIRRSEVHGVPQLVPERAVVGVSASRTQHHVDLFGDPHRRTEGSRLLAVAFLRVEPYAPAPRGVEPHFAHLPAGGLHQPVGRERSIELVRAEQPGRVRPHQITERHTDTTLCEPSQAVVVYGRALLEETRRLSAKSIEVDAAEGTDRVHVVAHPECVERFALRCEPLRAHSVETGRSGFDPCLVQRNPVVAIG